MTIIDDFAPELTGFLSELSVEPNDNSVTFGRRTVRGETTQEIRNELASAFYAELHAGVPVDRPKPLSPSRDTDFEALLVAGVPHATSPVEAEVVPDPSSGPDADTVLVEIGRTRVRVPAGTVVESRRDGDRVVLAMPAVRPALSPGFMLISGSAPASAGPGGDVLRLYAHVAGSAPAPSIWASVVRTLEERNAEYRAKVLSAPESFPRRDAIVVYLPEASWKHADAVADAMGDVPGLDAATSPLTMRLAPGIGMAWEPSDQRTGWKRMSFGQHRTAALADGVLRHLAGAPILEAIAAAFEEASIDPLEPARNLGSPDFSLTVRR